MPRNRNPAPNQADSLTASQPSQLPTFMDHIYELRRRLFWVVGGVLVASSLAYPFLSGIITILTAPLGDQQLYYLTPVGGFSFSLKICFYVGLLASIPLIIYHAYRFFEPLMGKWRRTGLAYMAWSFLLAAAGILFAYFACLPAALYFLTGLNLEGVQAMLTVDSYLSFVMTYLIGTALLFQIPLLLIIINTITPLKPGTLTKIQRYVIAGSFIVAAIISPTPDVMNQLMLALPTIAMYEVGVVSVWLQNRRQRKQQKVGALTFAVPVTKPLPAHAFEPYIPSLEEVAVMPPAPRRAQAGRNPAIATRRVPGAKVRMVQQRPIRRPAHIAAQSLVVRRLPMARPLVTPSRTIAGPTRNLHMPARSVDGFAPYQSQPNAISS